MKKVETYIDFRKYANNSIEFITNLREDLSGTARVIVFLNYGGKKPSVTGVSDFDGNVEDGQLPFVAGDVITVLDTDGEWWTGELNGETGVFPSSYVSTIEDSSLQVNYGIDDKDGKVKIQGCQPPYNLGNIEEGVEIPGFYSVFGNKPTTTGNNPTSTEWATNNDLWNGIQSEDGTILARGLNSMMKQLFSGYSIVIPVYGYSGSGKSYTLLNGKDSVLKQVIEACEGKASIELFNMFDIYGTVTNDTIDKNKLKIQNKLDFSVYNDGIKKAFNNIINPISDESNFEAILTTKKGNKVIRTVKKVDNSYFRLDQKNGWIKIDVDPRDDLKEKINTEPVDIFIQKITEHRQESDRKYIKPTPNNPESSRSHLLIILKITNADKPHLTGYLTLMDMAGIEDPIEISQMCNPLLPPNLILQEQFTIGKIIKDIDKYDAFWPSTSMDTNDIKGMDMVNVKWLGTSAQPSTLAIIPMKLIVQLSLLIETEPREIITTFLERLDKNITFNYQATSKQLLKQLFGSGDKEFGDTRERRFLKNLIIM